MTFYFLGFFLGHLRRFFLTVFFYRVLILTEFSYSYLNYNKKKIKNLLSFNAGHL
jgi:hypothetical protein